MAALPAISLFYGRALLDTLHERVGEEELLRGRTDLGPGSDDGLNGFWMRLLADSGERLGIYGRDGPQYDFDFQALQAGIDLYRAEDEDDHSRDHAGLYLAWGRGEGEITHDLAGLIEFHAGQDEFRAQTLGAYWTRFDEKSRYLDAVLQATWYDLTARSTRLAPVKTDGFGWAASLEGGWPWVLDDEENWRLEPQGQLIYQRVSVDGVRDEIAQIRFADAESLTGRLGVRLNRLWVGENDAGKPRLTNGWLRGNVWHEFEGKPEVAFASQTGFIPFATDLGGSWWELGIGITHQMSDTGYFYADVDYSASFDGKDRAWNGKLGVRWHW